MDMKSFKRDRPTIGVIPAWSPLIGDTPDRYLESIILGIQNAAQLKGCHLLLAWGIRQEMIESNNLYPAWPDVAPDSDFVPVGPWNTDGLIVLAPLRHPKRAAYLQQFSDRGFPIFFVATGEDGPTISVDNEKGIYDAVAHLVEHGHKRIAFLAGDPNDKGDSASRLRGYHTGVARYGLANDPLLVVDAWHNRQGGYVAMKELINSRVDFTAAVVSDDNSAIGAMQAIREAGLRVPNDIALIGFDDQPEALVQVPPLASIHVPLKDIGQQSLLMMLEYLVDGRPLESIQIPARLIPRQSCGCLPALVHSATKGMPLLNPVPQGESGEETGQIESAMQNLVEEMLVASPAEARHPEGEQIRRLCLELVEAFYERLQNGDSAHFQASLLNFLQEIERVDVQIDVWQEMISILRREMSVLPLDWQNAGIRLLAEDMLHQARAALSNSAQRRDLRHQSQRDTRAYTLGVLNSRLSASLNQGHIVEVLNPSLATVGIRHARLALFEAEGSDAVAWSIMPDRDPESSLHRFATREFPPPGMYPADEILNLVLLPLIFQEESLGYIAFDGSDLSPCTSIARQVAAALKASSLHGQVVELTLTDPLTGLHNRRYFDLFLRSEVLRSQRFARALAVLLVDVDDFKSYNDVYGHPEGDEALKQVAACLTNGRRTADVVARLGGDEFALILPETEVHGALEVARRIRAAVTNLAGLKRPITLSIGLSALPVVNVGPDVLVKEADLALYDAKRNGRNQTRIFTEDEEKSESGAETPAP